MTQSQEKSMALKDFLLSDKKFHKTIKRLNHLLDKEIAFQELNVPMPEGLEEELNEKLNLISKLQMQQMSAEMKLGFHKSIPHLN
jgi:hypothetical protein